MARLANTFAFTIFPHIASPTGTRYAPRMNVPETKRPAARPPRARRAASRRLFLFESLPSTNRWALDHAFELRHGDAVRAILQTAGRGRFERVWISPGDRGLAVTLLLRPPRRKDWMAQKCGFAAALAVRDTLFALGLPAQLKWPNDVMVRGCKIAGILAERNDPAGPVALGIGVNVNLTRADFHGAELLYPATSMRIETGRAFDVASVCKRLLRRFDLWWRKMDTHGPPCIRQAWARHDYLLDKTIAVRSPAEHVVGRYAGMDDEGRLILARPGEEVRLFWSGDVSLAPQS